MRRFIPEAYSSDMEEPHRPTLSGQSRFRHRGRVGREKDSRGSPVQVWAAWFPCGESPRSSIQGFPLDGLRLSARRQSLGGNSIGENFCRGDLNVDGRAITWDLRYRSTFHVTL